MYYYDGTCLCERMEGKQMSKISWKVLLISMAMLLISYGIFFDDVMNQAGIVLVLLYLSSKEEL